VNIFQKLIQLSQKKPWIVMPFIAMILIIVLIVFLASMGPSTRPFIYAGF